MVHVRRHGAARRALYPLQERACAGGPRLRRRFGTHPHLDRHRRRAVLPAADLPDPRVFRLAVVRGFLADRRGLLECRRLGALARQAAVAGRLRADGAAGRLRNHQTRRRARAPDRRRFQIREAAAMNLIRANMAPLMFVGMIVFMLIGYPAAFSLAATGLFFGFIGIEFGLIRPDFLGNLTYQLFGIISNDLLLAIPFFTFMGAILERCGLAEDLLDSIGQLFGPVRGGLSYAVIFVGAILGAITCTVAASVIALGAISIPVMIRN